MILYLDCSSGISGDMFVAALLSLAGEVGKRRGPLDKIVRPALRAAGIDKRLVSASEVDRAGVRALAFRVPEGPGFPTFDQLIMSMYASRVDQRVADGVAALAQRMAAAEREAYGEGHDDPDALGGLDTAVDLICAVALMHHLAPERVIAAPPALGGGTVMTAHGERDVPSPAVAVLLRDIPTLPRDEHSEPGELTTPTGAAVLAHYVNEFGPPPRGRMLAAGSGAGMRDLPARPNVLQAMSIQPAPEEETMDRDADRDNARGDREAGLVRRTVSGIAAGVRRGAAEQPEAPPAVESDQGADEPLAGETPASLEPVPEESEPDEAEAPGSGPEETREPATGDESAAEEAPDEMEPPTESVTGPAETKETEPMPPDAAPPLDHIVLEANIDDMAPELLAHACELLREAGALDVWMAQAFMKKGRPGVVLHVLCVAADHRRLADLVLAETTTFGLRVVPVGRLYAEERRETVRLGGHEIRVRLSMVDGRPGTVAPEYEDCRQAAEQLGRPVKVVYEAAQAAARARFRAG